MSEKIDALDLVTMQLHRERAENMKLRRALLALETHAHAKTIREKYKINPAAGDSLLADGTIQRAPKK